MGLVVHFLQDFYQLGTSILYLQLLLSKLHF